MKKLHISGEGWTLDYESEPMPESRFRALCGVAYALIGAAAFVGFFALFVGAAG